MGAKCRGPFQGTKHFVWAPQAPLKKCVHKSVQLVVAPRTPKHHASVLESTEAIIELQRTIKWKTQTIHVQMVRCTSQKVVARRDDQLG